MRLLLGLIFVLWCTLAGIGVDMLTHNRLLALIDNEREAAEREAFDSATHIGRNLSYTRSIPGILSSESDVLTVLRQSLPPSRSHQKDGGNFDRAKDELGRRLVQVRAEAGIDQILLIDATGECILASGFKPGVSIVGQNLADREYFRLAREGRRGHQFAVGRATGLPGLFFSVPVLAGEGFLGAVVAKIDLSRLRIEPDALVTDEFGTVVMAGQPQMLYRVMPNGRALSRAEQENRYGRADLVPIETAPWFFPGRSGLVLRDQDPVPLVVVDVDGIEDIVNVHVYRSLQERGSIIRQGWGLFVLLDLLGLLLLAIHTVAVAYLKNQREHGLALEQMNQILAGQANSDPLTGCANRRRFLEVLETEWHRAKRYGDLFSVVMVDLDHFKAINDRFGHSGGDEALRHFVAVTRATLRPSDLLGRLGGEEFALLLPSTDSLGAAITAERVRAAIEASETVVGEHSIRFTISAGVATWSGGSEETANSMLERADGALYHAKEKGRNRIECVFPQAVA